MSKRKRKDGSAMEVTLEFMGRKKTFHLTEDEIPDDGKIPITPKMLFYIDRFLAGLPDFTPEQEKEIFGEEDGGE